MKKSNVVVTITLGAAFEKIARITHPPMRDYASRIGADFSVVGSTRFSSIHPHYEKYQVADLFDQYSRILYLDSDVLVSPSAPDIFSIVPAELLGVRLTPNLDAYFAEEFRLVQVALGDIGWSSGYFNAGVLVLGSPHRGLFDLELGAYVGRFGDQSQLNYNARKLELPLFDIGPRFNHTRGVTDRDRRDSYFIHYAGRGFERGRAKDLQVLDDARALGVRAS